MTHEVDHALYYRTTACNDRSGHMYLDESTHSNDLYYYLRVHRML